MKTRNLLWQIPLIFLITAPLWWDIAADFLDPNKEVSYSKKRPEKNFVMDKVTMVQSRDGKEELILNADKVSSKENQKILFLENVKSQMLGKNQQVDVSGNEAVYDTEKQIITLLNNVELTSSDGNKLNTSVLRYFTKYKKMKSAAPLEFSRERMEIIGESFYYDLNSGNFRVGRRVVCNMW